MPLVPMRQILEDARREGYAVCYCESWNLESFQAVLEAAEELQSPIIVGFNGGFLMHPSRSKPETLAFYAGMAQAIEKSTVPVSFLLNESDDYDQIKEGLELGFNAVMVESHHLSYEDYRSLVRKVVALAHARGVFVEGQIGELPNGWEGPHGEGVLTDPRLARTFVEETGVDALSVSIGNVHILTKGKSPVDLETLARIQAEIKVPLVIHGGTGFPAEAAGDVIRRGVAKFNFGTGLKQAYLNAISKSLASYQEPMNPHFFLGMGGAQDILVAGREAVKNKAKELIVNYGYAGNLVRT
ncbi:MAG: class II fructose-bisphosphate aldolase [Terriglobia bacterium]